MSFDRTHVVCNNFTLEHMWCSLQRNTTNVVGRQSRKFRCLRMWGWRMEPGRCTLAMLHFAYPSPSSSRTCQGVDVGDVYLPSCIPHFVPRYSLSKSCPLLVAVPPFDSRALEHGIVCAACLQRRSNCRVIERLERPLLKWPNIAKSWSTGLVPHSCWSR